MSTHWQNNDRSKSDTRSQSRNRPTAALLCLSLLTGCAVHTYDPRTGTEHLWGFGHLKMGVATAQDSSKTQAILTGVRTAGIRLDLAPNTRGIALGYDDTRIATVLDARTPLKIQTIAGEPFTLQLGAPPAWASHSH